MRDDRSDVETTSNGANVYMYVRDFTPPLQRGVAQIPKRPTRRRKYIYVYAQDGMGTSAAGGRQVIDVVSVGGHCLERYIRRRAGGRADW